MISQHTKTIFQYGQHNQMGCLASSITSVDILTLLLIAVGIAIAVVSILAFVIRISIFVKSHKYNREENSIDMPAQEIADSFLKETGIEGVQVKQAGFFRAIFFGNSYSSYTKTIYLRKSIFQKKSLTAVAIACQKVGLAIQHKEQNKKFLFVQIAEL